MGKSLLIQGTFGYSQRLDVYLKVLFLKIFFNLGLKIPPLNLSPVPSTSHLQRCLDGIWVLQLQNIWKPQTCWAPFLKVISEKSHAAESLRVHLSPIYTYLAKKMVLLWSPIETIRSENISANLFLIYGRGVFHLKTNNQRKFLNRSNQASNLCLWFTNEDNIALYWTPGTIWGQFGCYNWGWRAGGNLMGKG